ncbi:MAG TPA: hypothetical protein VFC79_00190 [Tissierellaceae bacterium]|nr:hypothetical protein [Tissierellaceae bacterium]
MELTNKEKSIILSTMLCGISEGYLPRGVTEEEMEDIFVRFGMSKERYGEMVRTYNYDIDECKVGG